MAKKGAQKTGSPDPGGKARNSAMAKRLAKEGVKRTSFRDPITGSIIACGTYPGLGHRAEEPRHKAMIG